MDPEIVKHKNPQMYYTAFLKEGVRPDYRKINKPRQYAICLLENQCIVRIGNTAVTASLQPSEQTLIQGWSNLGCLGDFKQKLTITVIVDDGNTIQAVWLSCQIVLRKSNLIFPFSFGVLYGYTIRDPTLNQQNLSQSLITVLLDSESILVDKQKGDPISVREIQSLISSCRPLIEFAQEKVRQIYETGSFIGKLYSKS